MHTRRAGKISLIYMFAGAGEILHGLQRLIFISQMIGTSLYYGKEEKQVAETKTEWFDQLYEEHMPHMRNVARRSLDSMESAEDIVQDVFVLLLGREGEIRAYERSQGWLYTALYKQIGSYLQRAKYRKTVPVDSRKDLFTEDAYSVPLSECLPAGLTAKEREILLLFYEQGLSYEEIAQRLRCTVLTCRTRMCRAKARCKKLLEEET